VAAFSAVVHPPRTAIPTVGLIAGRAVPIDGQPVVRLTTIVGRSFTHRVIDGARAAQFLDTHVGRI
jgi:pyruvate/2-oxoglutarate dehydrogenase complex dihydrolipoamide acyltransferase (E2) component